jgi:hypothetical protein
MDQFEIFTVEAEGDIKSAAIDELLGYPNVNTQTDTYRCLLKHVSQDLWAGVVDDVLVEACGSMSDVERAQYYNDSDLKDSDYLEQNNWYGEME